MQKPVFTSLVVLLSMLALVGCGKRSTASAPAENDAVAVVDDTPQLIGSDEGRSSFSPTIDENFPTLPAETSLQTTEEQLEAQALIAAYEEWHQGAIDKESIAERQQAIMAFWIPQWQDLRAILLGIEAENDAWNDYELAEATRVAAWERQNKENDIVWDARLAEEKRKTLPIVPASVQAALIRRHRAIGRSACRSCLR